MRQSDCVFPQQLKMQFPCLTPCDMTSCKESYMTAATSLGKHNTSVSSFNFLHMTTQPVCLHLHNKGKRQPPLTKWYNSSSDWRVANKEESVSVCVQEAYLRMEWNSLSHSLYVAQNSLPWTAVSLWSPSRSALCAAQVNGVDRRLSSGWVSWNMK